MINITDSYELDFESLGEENSSITSIIPVSYLNSLKLFSVFLFQPKFQ